LIKQRKIRPRFLTLVPLSKFINIGILIFIFFFQYGCTSLKCVNILRGNTDIIKISYAIADNLARSALPPLVPRHPDMPILVTTFVNNNNLQQTSTLGRVLQEQIASRFVQLGYTVREIKLSNTLHIEPKSGETILSRDLTQLSDAQTAQAILVGTISRTNQVLYISARLISPSNNNILASDDYQLCLDNDILNMLGLQHQNDSEAPIAEPQPPLLNSIL
jgi:TolB-like protein